MVAMVMSNLLDTVLLHQSLVGLAFIILKVRDLVVVAQDTQAHKQTTLMAKYEDLHEI